MNTLSRFIHGFILLIALVSYSANAKIKVVTTFTIIQDIAQNVAGDAADVVSITKAGAEIHDYQPTPKDIVKAQSADLILWNGMNLERWFKKFFQNMSHIPSVTVTEGISPLSIYSGPYQGKPNPHAWMSADNGLIYVENIRKALVDIDPNNADTYNRNARDYSARISQLSLLVKQGFSSLPDEKRWLVTSEGAFSYLARDFGLSEAYLWPINAEQQGSPKQVKKLIDKINTHAMPVIFSESTISDRAAKQVAKETGITYGGVLFVDSLSDSNGPVPTYLDMLKVTTDTIMRGLEQ
ncbi:metal ABC transporter substrate-binding protein [Vibrio sp. 99-8-1]|uniref:metal ABC transporter substrate-binding protein n=1 Tax=Vibrio sp. 99-8-1 TaxID=2607602 RepID=UPI0014938223|nr:metal ABC transporter substrate-binding protein [Vibrio sp. 99-8-1]NOI66816.1 metal ABC transporter substrate-binding protein [Vibrio sp. 99-8-1]